MTFEAMMLTPSQAQVRDQLLEVLNVKPLAVLEAPVGTGATSILREVGQRIGGRRLDVSDILKALARLSPRRYENAICDCLMDALDSTDTLFVEHLDYIDSGRIMHRSGFINLVHKQLIERAHTEPGKRVILAVNKIDSVSTFGEMRGALVRMPRITSADYAVYIRNILGAERSAGVDADLLRRYSSDLNGYQIRLACELMAGEPNVTTAQLIACLRDEVLKDNARHTEIEQLSFEQLPGFEDLAEKLELNVVLPLTDGKAARERGIKPKHGVLLYGPPGTGKTSVGRALAHRLQGKFFLVDGTFLAQPAAVFFWKLGRVVADAQANAPSVLFIDDADVLFTNPHLAGLTRYLLSMLDGIASEASRGVCVMMTAMDVKKMPDALLRSGRVELWLETKAPDSATAARIIGKLLGTVLPAADAIDGAELGELSQGFTPADLRRVVSDAHALYAYDLAKSREPTTAQEYLRRAIANLRANRKRMSEVLAAA